MARTLANVYHPVRYSHAYADVKRPAVVRPVERNKALGLIDRTVLPVRAIKVQPGRKNVALGVGPRKSKAVSLGEPVRSDISQRATDKRMSEDYRKVCKRRPDGNKRGSGSGAKEFVPWCR